MPYALRINLLPTRITLSDGSSIILKFKSGHIGYEDQAFKISIYSIQNCKNPNGVKCSLSVEWEIKLVLQQNIQPQVIHITRAVLYPLLLEYFR